MFNNTPQVGQEVLNVPFGEMIKSMAFAIAEAQLRLDENSIEVAEMMGGLKAVTYELNGEEHLNFEDSRVFFGKQKLSVSNAVDTHNTTTDQAQRQTIRNESGNSTELDVSDYQDLVAVSQVGTTEVYDSPTATSLTNVIGQYYYTGTSGAYVWYKCTDASTTPKYQKTTAPKDIRLKLKTGASGEDVVYVAQRVSMMELGFTPTFYQFVDSMIDVTVAISFTQEGESSYSKSSDSRNKSGNFSFGFRRGSVGGGSRKAVSTTQVNASYTQKYSYSAEASSSLRTKLVPIPAPAILEERIRLQMELSREEATAE